MGIFGGPFPGYTPWTVDDDTASYSGCVRVPFNVTGGDTGPGTINAGGIFVSGVAVATTASVASAIAAASVRIHMESLTIATVNVVPALAHTATGLCLLVFNGSCFLPVGGSPPFSVSGNQITWLSAMFDLHPGETVQVAYSY